MFSSRHTSLAALLAALALAGCTDDPAESTAQLYLMDAPPTGVTSVIVHVASIQVHVDDKSKTTSDDAADSKKDADGKWRTLTYNKPVDLVLAQTETAAIKLGELALPDGKITQIRLMLDATQKNTAKVNDKTCDLDLSKVKDGIKINHAFKALDVGVGKKHQAWVDFKLDEAMEATKDCYALKPVLKLTKFKTDGAEVPL